MAPKKSMRDIARAENSSNNPPSDNVPPNPDVPPNDDDDGEPELPLHDGDIYAESDDAPPPPAPPADDGDDGASTLEDPLVRIMVNGVVREVPQSLAQDIESERESRQVAQQPSSSEPGQSNNSEDDFFANLEEIIFEKPGEAMRMVYDKAVQDTETRLTQRYNQTTILDRFWEDFYRDNKDLDRGKHGPIVDTIVTQNKALLDNMSMEKAGPWIAQETKKYLMTLGVPAKKGSTKDTTTLEGGISTPPAQRAQKTQQEDQDTNQSGSLTSLLRQRNEQRRKANRSARMGA